MLKVLVTRPRIFAEPLCAKIAALGAMPILFPTIELCPLPDTTLLLQQLETLHEYDMAIFSSRPAVLYGMKAIRQRWPSLPKLRFATVGKSTAEELMQMGISTVLHPENPPYESEALLALPQLQNLAGKKIILFRGNDGRMLLYETLKARGSEVSVCETYQRRLPKRANIEIPDVIIVTSPQCLTNLKKLVGREIWYELRQCSFITVGWRTYNLSATLGIRERYLADGADDTHLIQALTHLRNGIQ